MFQASDARDRHFLNLLDDDLHPIEPLYSKGGSCCMTSFVLESSTKFSQVS